MSNFDPKLDPKLLEAFHKVWGKLYNLRSACPKSSRALEGQAINWVKFRRISQKWTDLGYECPKKFNINIFERFIHEMAHAAYFNPTMLYGEKCPPMKALLNPLKGKANHHEVWAAAITRKVLDQLGLLDARMAGLIRAGMQTNCWWPDEAIHELATQAYDHARTWELAGAVLDYLRSENALWTTDRTVKAQIG